MKKWVSRIIDGIMGALILSLLGVQVAIIVSAKNNYNVPSLFGYSFMQVLTDSMAGNDDPVDNLYDSNGKVIASVTKLGPLSLAKGTGIVIEKAAPASIKVGEAITFYSDRLKAPITHRVIAIETETDGSLVYLTFGDNPKSETCSTWVNGAVPCTYPSNEDVVPEKYLIGRVVWHNDAFGAFLGVVQSAWFVPVAVLLPLTVIATMSAIDLIKQSKAEEKAENDAIAAEISKSGLDPKDEKAVVAFTEKARYKYEIEQEMKEEMAKEKEKVAKAVAKEKAKELKRLKKEKKNGSLEDDKIRGNHDQS